MSDKIRVVEYAVDFTIGRLDRVLSEFLRACERPNLECVDAMTLRHHADDLIGVGTKALEVLKERGLE
jgi:hypothetical protein